MLRNAPGTIAPALVANTRFAGGAAFILSVGLFGGRAQAQQTEISNPNFAIGSGSSDNLGSGSWTFNLDNPTSLINFDTYGIPAGATVTYVFSPGGGGFVVYNNIDGSDPSLIDGTLNGGGGTIYLINPAGVIFGPGAQMLDVGTLYAAAGSLADPTNPSNTFEIGTGQIEIQALSTVSATEAVHLIGANVVNGGTVNAGNLITMVAATGTVTIFPDSSNPQIFSVSAAGTEPPTDQTAGVRNNGTISVGNGGTIRIGAADIYAAGIVNAASASIQAANGTIRLDAVDGNVNSIGQLVAGTVDVNAAVLKAAGTIRADAFDLSGDLVATDDLTITGQEIQGEPVSAAAITIGGGIDGDGAEGSSVSVTLDGTISSIGGDVGAIGTVGSFTTTGNLVLTGAGNQRIAATAGALALGGDVTKATGDLSLLAGTTIDVDGSIESTSGSLTATSGGAMTFGGNLAGGAGVTLTSGGELNVSGSMSSAASGIAVVAAESMSIGGAVNALNDVTLTSAANLTAGGSVASTVGSVSLAAGDALTLAGDATGATNLTLSGTSIELAASGLQTLAATAGALELTGNLTKAEGNLALGAGTSMTVNDDLRVSAGSLNATATDAISLGGSVEAENDLTLSGASIELKSTEAQSIIADTGAMTLNGSVTKTAGDLTLDAGTTLDVNGSVTATAGSLTATSTGAMSISGDVTGGTDVTLTGASIVLDNAAAQSIAAGEAGALTLNGSVTKATGDLSLVAGTTLDVNGSVTATAGSLAATAADAMSFSGNLSGKTGVTLGGAPITLDGGSAQSITASSGAIALNDSVTKATGNLRLEAGTTLVATDDVVVTAGALVALSKESMSFGGSLTAGTNVELNAGDLQAGGGAIAIAGNVAANAGSVSITSKDAITLGGNVTGATSTTVDGTSITLTSESVQSITATAGAMLLNGDIAKTAGNLDVAAGTNLDAFGDLTIGAGSLTMTSTGLMRVGGDVQASNNVTLSAGSISLVGEGESQSLSATAGALTLTGNTTKLIGDLGLTAGATLDVNGSLGVTAGSLSATAAEGMQFSGDLFAGTNVTLDGSAITLDGGATQAITAEDGALTLNGSLTKENGELVLIAGTTIDVDDDLQAASFSATAGTALNLSGAVSAEGFVSLLGATIRLADNVTAGNQLLIDGDVTLDADSTWTAASMNVDGKIDGAHALTIDADGAATFLGDVGTTTRLTGFTANSGLILFLTDSAGTEDAGRVVRADTFSLNQTERAAGAAVDLGANGNLSIETDAFSVSAGRKITVAGDLTIGNGVVDGAGVASTSVTIGDVNTGGLFTINTQALTIETRLPGTSITSVGPVSPDYGVDFVSLGGFDFRFESLEVTDGGNAPTFASPGGNGDLNDNLGAFTMYNTDESTECVNGLSGGRGLTIADFYSTSPLQFFDIVAKNTITNPVTVIAGAIDEFQPTPESTPTSASQDLEDLGSLGPIFRSLRLRSASEQELEALANGGAVLMDLDGGLGFGVAGAGGEAPTSLSRLARGRVRELLATDAELNAFLDAGSAGFEANKAAFERAAKALQTAASDGRPLGDVVREMAATGDLTGLTAARLIGEYVQRGESLGLTSAESGVLRDAAGVGANWPQAIVPAQLGVTDASNPLFGFDVPGGAFDKDFWSAIAASGAGR